MHSLRHNRENSMFYKIAMVCGEQCTSLLSHLLSYYDDDYDFFIEVLPAMHCMRWCNSATTITTITIDATTITITIANTASVS